MFDIVSLLGAGVGCVSALVVVSLYCCTGIPVVLFVFPDMLGFTSWLGIGCRDFELGKITCFIFF